MIPMKNEGYSDKEVLERYGEVSHSVPPDEYAKAAIEALSKLSPDGRVEFLKMLQERAAAHGVKLPGKVASDPQDLGNVLTDLHEKPGQLRDILRPSRCPVPGASVKLQSDRGHAVVPDGQGRARGHRGHCRQTHDGWPRLIGMSIRPGRPPRPSSFLEADRARKVAAQAHAFAPKLSACHVPSADFRSSYPLISYRGLRYPSCPSW